MLQTALLFIGLAAGLAMAPLSQADAAQVALVAEPGMVGPGGMVEIAVILDTAGDTINIVEGSIRIPLDAVAFYSMTEKGAIVPLWLERPALGADGRVVFSGVIPGGFRGKGVLLTLLLEGRRPGVAVIAPVEVKVLRSDGFGTEVSVEAVAATVTISEDAPSIATREEDRPPPEDFAPQVVRNPLLFDGAWTLVFATQDKESGVSHYEVREARWPWFDRWQTTESPYKLLDQKLSSQIAVRAMDRAGNERTITLAPRRPLRWYQGVAGQAAFVVGVAVLINVVLLLWRGRRRA